MPTDRRRGRGRGGTLLVLLACLALVGGGFLLFHRGVGPLPGPEGCTAEVGGTVVDLSTEQAENAATISAVAVRRGLPARAASIALATAFQESKLRNLRDGDRDSVGLFQQRPSQGWGSAEQLRDPVYAANAFYDALEKYQGYETADITKIAQRVQKSGFPEAYRDHEGQGRVLASTLTGHSPAGLTCRLDAVKTSLTPQRVAADLSEQMGVTSVRPGEGVLTVTARDRTTAWAVAQWAVARAEIYGASKISVGDRVWDRSKGDEGWSSGSDGTTVTITLG